ncbi:hypothetical protein I550_3838 [Mycobacterium intracellulare 1956]|uniref:Uncharacterized protein n=1 Tax=Mycobacterium intracellulare 1956 TaxID=1299331 RepID=X8CJR6_MYCIT|nr:hypothetical protein I550_3838 [Mycobacterium intracellulare 1956]
MPQPFRLAVHVVNQETDLTARRDAASRPMSCGSFDRSKSENLVFAVSNST